MAHPKSARWSLLPRSAVVFVHGNPGPAADWRRLVARTGTFARAIAPDMPGYGAVLRLYRATDAAAGAVDPHPTAAGLDRPALVMWGERDPSLRISYLLSLIVRRPRPSVAEEPQLADSCQVGDGDWVSNAPNLATNAASPSCHTPAVDIAQFSTRH